MADRILNVVVAALLAAALGQLGLREASAEEPAEPAPPPVIVTIEADEVPDVDAVELSGLAPGQELTGAAARAAIRALWATGRFRDVRIFESPVEGGVAVRIALVSSQTIRSLEVEGNRALSERVIVQATGYMAGETWRPEDRARVIESLQGAYRERGYPSAEVELVEEPVDGDPAVVTLRLAIEEGEPIRVADLVLRGRLGLDEADLRAALGVGAGDVYDRVRLRDGLTRMLERYRAEGYYRARVDTGRVAAVVSAEGEARVVVPVDSGDHYAITFVGNRHIADSELEAVLRIEEEQSLTSSVLDLLAARLRDHYRDLGFHHARVEWRLFRAGRGERRIAFRVRAGPRVSVRRIEFEGNEHFDDRYLRRQVIATLQERLAAGSVWSRVTDEEVSAVGVTGEGREAWRPAHRYRPALRVHPARTFVEDAYREALEHIQRLYEADGFLQARLDEPELDFSDRGRQLTVTIRVEEGPQTFIRSITVGGNRALTDTRVERALGLDVDVPLDRFEAEQARRRLRQAYRSQGYMYAAIESEEYLSEDGLWADLHYVVDEGDQVLVRSVILRGNHETLPSLIRERVALRAGDIYTPQAAQASERALVELGIFSSVSVSLADPEQPAPVKDVIVEVEERRPNVVELRPGFSTADGPRLRMRYNYRNLFGYGVDFGIGVDVSYQIWFTGTPPSFEEFVRELDWQDQVERLVVGSITMPHLPRIGRWVGLRFDATHERDNDPGFGVTRTGTSVALTARYRPYLTAQLQLGVEYSDITPVNNLPLCVDPDLGGAPDPGENCLAFCDAVRAGTYPDIDPVPGTNCIERTRQAVTLARQPEGSTWFLVSGLLVSGDFRDSAFNPTQGFFGSISLQHVFSLRPVVYREEEVQSNFLRFTALANGYVPLGFLDWVLALSVRFGWIFELMFPGEDELGDPSKRSTTFADRYFYLGGFDAMRGWAEESLPTEDDFGPGGQAMLLLRAELRIPLPESFALGLFVDAGDIWRQQTSLWRDFGLRVSVGVGLRYNTPVGPLALDLGWPIPRPSELDDIRAIDEEQDRQAEWIAVWTPQLHFSIGLF